MYPWHIHGKIYKTIPALSPKRCRVARKLSCRSATLAKKMLNSSKSMEPLWSMSINLKTCRQVATTWSTRAAMKKKKAQFRKNMCSCFEPRPWLEASICNMIETHRNNALFHTWHVFLISSDLHNHESLSMSSCVLTESHGSHCHTFFREFFEHRTPNLGEWCTCSWPHSFNLRDLRDDFFQPCFYYFQISTIFNLTPFLSFFFIFNIASKLQVAQVAFAKPQSRLCFLQLGHSRAAVSSSSSSRVPLLSKSIFWKTWSW